MKKTLIAILILLNSSLLHADEILTKPSKDVEETCQMSRMYAQMVFVAHQKGMNEKELIDKLDTLNSPEPMKEYFKGLVRIAYDNPIYPTEDEMLKELNQFGDNIYEGCIEGISSAIDEANKASQ